MTCKMSCTELFTDADILGFMNMAEWQSQRRNGLDINGFEIEDDECTPNSVERF